MAAYKGTAKDGPPLQTFYEAADVHKYKYSLDKWEKYLLRKQNHALKDAQVRRLRRYRNTLVHKLELPACLHKLHRDGILSRAEKERIFDLKTRAIEGRKELLNIIEARRQDGYFSLVRAVYEQVQQKALSEKQEKEKRGKKSKRSSFLSNLLPWTKKKESVKDEMGSSPKMTKRLSYSVTDFSENLYEGSHDGIGAISKPVILRAYSGDLRDPSAMIDTSSGPSRRPISRSASMEGPLANGYGSLDRTAGKVSLNPAGSGPSAGDYKIPPREPVTKSKQEKKAEAKPPNPEKEADTSPPPKPQRVFEITPGPVKDNILTDSTEAKQTNASDISTEHTSEDDLEKAVPAELPDSPSLEPWENKIEFHAHEKSRDIFVPADINKACLSARSVSSDGLEALTTSAREQEDSEEVDPDSTRGSIINLSKKIYTPPLYKHMERAQSAPIEIMN